jgi:hypothetical protein
MHKRRLPEANQDCEAQFSARDGPLGESLVLQPCLETNRAAIEARLPKLGRTVDGFNYLAGGAVAEMDKNKPDFVS